MKKSPGLAHFFKKEIKLKATHEFVEFFADELLLVGDVLAVVFQHFPEGLELLEDKVAIKLRAVVVAQLVERSLPIPEVRGSNPVIGKNLFIH